MQINFPLNQIFLFVFIRKHAHMVFTKIAYINIKSNKNVFHSYLSLNSDHMYDCFNNKSGRNPLQF